MKGQRAWQLPAAVGMCTRKPAAHFFEVVREKMLEEDRLEEMFTSFHPTTKERTH